MKHKFTHTYDRTIVPKSMNPSIAENMKEELNFFLKWGYLVIDNALNQDEVNTIREAFNDTFEKLKRFNNSGKLIIGICLGAQFLTSGSEEAPNVSGLGFIKGKCKSLLKHPEYKGRVPRVGWSALRSSIYERHSFYFVHSFYMDIEDDNRNTKIELCSDGVTAMVEQQNLLAMQFHPEKSNSSGLSIVKSFIERNA